MPKKTGFLTLHKKDYEIDKIILLSAISSDMLCGDETLENIIMNKKQKILSEHTTTRSIWQNKTTGKWCTKLGEDKHMVVRKERCNLENAFVEFYLSQKSLSATFADAFVSTCQHMKNIGSDAMKTINEYKNDCNRMIARTKFSKLPLSLVTEKDLIQFFKDLVYGNDKLPRKRFNAAKTIIRSVFNHARIEMNIECLSVKNIMDDLRFPSSAFKDTNSDDKIQVFKNAEIKLIKNHLKDTTDLLELGILLTIETGVRLGELCSLQRKDIPATNLKIQRSEHKAAFDDGYRYFIDAPKKNKCRNIILSEDANAILNRIIILHNSNWLFPSADDSDMWTRSYFFDKTIRRICRELQISVRSLHKARKTYSSNLLAQGIPDKLAQKQLGHADIATTHQAYYYDIFDSNEKLNALKGIKIG